MAVSVVLIGMAAYPFVLATMLGEPFQYTDSPFQLCLPDQEYVHDTDCIQPPAGFAFHPGETVPMLVGRCYSDPFNKFDGTVYTLHRRLVSDQNGLTISVGDTFATVAKGCSLQRLVEHAIPLETPPGSYHFEGFAELHVWKSANVAWRSQTFDVD